MGLTDKGFVRRTYDDILNDKIQRAKELFGENIDTSDQTPLGKFIRINAYDQAQAEEEIEQVYYARFPNTASGQSLDRLLPFVGITRNPASAAVYSVKITGEVGYVITPGFLVATDAGITYWAVQEYTIGDDGTCVIEVSCTEAGTVGNLSSASSICKVVNPVVNITSAVGLECLTAGMDEESDADLRERFAASVSGAGSCNENAIRAAILRVPTVKFAVVIVNDTDETDNEGRPPHSFECFVLGGDEYSKEIAEAIVDKRPVGIRTVGDNAVTITDVSGTERIVYYSPAKKVPVNVRVSIKTTPSFRDDGVAQVQLSVADYINTIGIGNSLVLSTIYGHIYSVLGVQEV
ncbi:MAG: baseplate J/gp47 family protein, partial [Clostridia bacterium]|nr:baseplate J/gp47 family protein [Clostridia bacterium]